MTLRPLTKWSHVVYQNSRSASSTTSDKVRQIIGWTLVCVSIHLECWLDKAKVKIVTWAAVSVACLQQFNYNSVFKIWQCECNWRGFNLHLMHIRWMQINFAFKKNQVWNGVKWLLMSAQISQLSTLFILDNRKKQCSTILTSVGSLILSDNRWEKEMVDYFH